jgi:hypothetical protein
MAGRKNHRGWGHIRQLPNRSKRYQASYTYPRNTTGRHYAPVTFTTPGLTITPAPLRRSLYGPFRS